MLCPSKTSNWILVYLEFLELLLRSRGRNNLQDFEAHSLGQRSALASSDNVTHMDITEARGHVNGHVPVSLLESVVFLDEVEVVSADDDGTVHLHLEDSPSHNASTDRNVAGEGALLVDVGAFLGLAGDLESKANLMDVAQSHLPALHALKADEGDAILLLECSFVQIHGCGSARTNNRKKKAH